MPKKTSLVGAMKEELSAARLVRAQQELVRLWHEKEAALGGWEDVCRELPVPEAGPLRLAGAIARVNTFQWHEEDKARDPSASDGVIAAVKRTIDKSNQRRVDAIEELDSLLERRLQELGVKRDARLPLSSETPGSLVDRLSILVLKLYHMDEQRRRQDIAAEQERKFAAKLKTLREQLADLTRCLDELVGDVLAGRRRFKTYFQLKMYNDPETNPFLRKDARPAAR